jgi:hypothetical protein
MSKSEERRGLIDPMLVGWNSFVGVDHFSSARARNRAQTLTAEGIFDTLQAASRSGATGFTFTSGTAAIELLDFVRKRDPTFGFNLYPLIPDTDALSDLINRGVIGMTSEVLRHLSPLRKAKAVVKGGWTALTSNPYSAMEIYVDYVLSSLDSVRPRGWSIRSILLQESVTDAAALLHATKPVQRFLGYVKSRFDILPGLQTRNLSRVVKLLREAGVPLSSCLIMTPVNEIGFQYAPSRTDLETTLSDCPEANVVAISALAGGQLNPTAAATYLRKFPCVQSVGVGVSTPQHSADTFRTLRSQWAESRAR